MIKPERVQKYNQAALTQTDALVLQALIAAARCAPVYPGHGAIARAAGFKRADTVRDSIDRLQVAGLVRRWHDRAMRWRRIEILLLNLWLDMPERRGGRR